MSASSFSLLITLNLAWHCRFELNVWIDTFGLIVLTALQDLFTGRAMVATFFDSSGNWTGTSSLVASQFFSESLMGKI